MIILLTVVAVIATVVVMWGLKNEPPQDYFSALMVLITCWLTGLFWYAAIALELKR